MRHGEWNALSTELSSSIFRGATESARCVAIVERRAPEITVAAESQEPRVVVDTSVLMAGIFELQEPFLCRVGIQPVSTSGRKIGNHLIWFTRKQALYSV